MLPDTNDDKNSTLYRYLQECIPNFCIDEKMRKALCFQERLEVFHRIKTSVKLEPIGKYLVSVESIGPKSQEFFVQISLTMTINSHPMASNITSSATKELCCIEEKKHESLGLTDSFCEKNVYIGYGDDGYFLKIMGNAIDDGQSRAICSSLSDSLFISDGCSILLMRYLAMTDFHGTLCFHLITIEGTIIKCHYECSNVDMKINNANVEVFEIVQKFYIGDSVTSTIKTVLSKQGNLLSINTLDSPYIIKINPHVDYCIHHQKPINLPLREEWKEDFELISKHFDKKIFEEDRKRKYLLLHSEINELLSDYIQSLLCKKPEDVLQFTIDHFKILISQEKNGDSPKSFSTR